MGILALRQVGVRTAQVASNTLRRSCKLGLYLQHRACVVYKLAQLRLSLQAIACNSRLSVTTKEHLSAVHTSNRRVPFQYIS